MLLIILRYFFGYVKVEVCGFAPERFMNLIIKNEIVIWDVEHIDQGYIFCIGRKNLMKTKPLLQKTNIKLKIWIAVCFKTISEENGFCDWVLHVCSCTIYSFFICMGSEGYR